MRLEGQIKKQLEQAKTLKKEKYSTTQWNKKNKKNYINRHDLENARGVKFTLVENVYGDLGSNSGRGWLHFI